MKTIAPPIASFNVPVLSTFVSFARYFPLSSNIKKQFVLPTPSNTLLNIVFNNDIYLETNHSLLQGTYLSKYLLRTPTRVVLSQG